MAKPKYHPTAYPGVRYREHPERIHKRQPDRYYFIRYYQDGKRREEGMGWASEGWTPERVHTELAAIKANIRSGSGHQSLTEKREALAMERDEEAHRDRLAARKTVAFADLASMYIAWASENKASWRDDNARLDNHILPTLGHLPLASVTRSAIEELKTSLAHKTITKGKNTKTKLAPETIRHCLALVRNLFNFAAETPYSDDDPDVVLFSGRNPVKGVRLPKQDNTRMSILDEDEADLLLTTAVAMPYSEDDPHLWHDLFLAGLHTGARAGELCPLPLEACGTHEIVILDTKTGRNRILPVDNALRPILERRRAEAKTPYLFPAKDSGPLRVDVASHAFRRIAKAAGMNAGVTDRRLRITFHSLRHTFATWLLVEGVDLYTVQQLLGHASIKTTERYLKPAQALRQRAASSLGNKAIGKVVRLTPPGDRHQTG